MALAGYNRYKDFTIDGDTYLSGDLTDREVAMHMDNSESDFWDNNPPVGGGGVRWALTDDTLLNFYPESYNTTTDNAIWKVKVPTLLGSTDTVIRLWYDADSESDGSNKEGTYDANYMLKCNLNEDQTEGAFDDATSNNNNGTNTGTVDVAGVIGRGRAWTLNDKINFGSGASIDDLHDGAFTVAGWFNFDGSSVSDIDVLVSKSTDAGADGWFVFLFNNAGNIEIRGVIFAPTTGAFSVVTNPLISVSTDTHLRVTYDDAGDRKIRIYINGVEATTYSAQVAAVGAIATDAGLDLYLGQQDDTIGRYYDGMQDDFSLSNVVRSDDWGIADYQSGLGTWITIGGMVVVAAGIAVLRRRIEGY